jgi:heat shock protein HslJ
MAPRIVAALLALTTLAACSLMRPPAVAVATASSTSLLDTRWRLTQLGDEIVQNAVGEREVHMTLHSVNTNVTGSGGCNSLFGRYALEKDRLKFDGLGGTKMFCDGRMELEQRFHNALLSAMRWRITGNTLELFDDRNAAAATFVGAPATG